MNLRKGGIHLRSVLNQKGPRTTPVRGPFVSSGYTAIVPDTWDSASLAAALGTLGYPGFSHKRKLAHRPNAAEVLLAAITSDDLQVRVIEALPWLASRGDIDWDRLVREAIAGSVQNRLGFVVTLARQLSEAQQRAQIAAQLRRVEEQLDRIRTEREDTLSQSSLSQAERRWLRSTRPPEAAHWALLIDLTAESLPYAER